MTWKIVVDSGCDLKTLPNIAPNTTFERVPLSIQIGDETFIDDITLNIDDMMEKMYATATGASSACPSPEAFATAYQGAENVIAITITGGLSGSYNSAVLGKSVFLETNQANVHIVDSLSAGGEIDLLVYKINEFIKDGLSFEQVVEAITAYQQKTKLLFVLAKVDNLVKNGRLNKLIGTVVGLLNIRMVGEASSEGKLELLQKPRGEKKAVVAAIEEMKKAGYAGGKIVIAHRNNPGICQSISEKVHAEFPDAIVEAIETSGLCSFYGEEGGILMGYEV